MPQDGAPLIFPVVFNATFIGGGKDGVSDNGGFQIRDNFGGQYSNSIFTDFLNEAVDIEEDGDTDARFNAGEIIFSSNIWWDFAYNPNIGSFTNTANALGDVWDGTTSAGTLEDTVWTDESLGNVIRDPGIRGLDRRSNGGLDPRPAAGGPASTTSLVTIPSDGFFQTRNFAGAFDPDASGTWLDEWTVLWKLGLLPGAVGPFSGDADLGGGWFYSDFFGSYNVTYDPWFFHNRHGFIYLAEGAGSDGFFFFDIGINAWWYSSPFLYPNMFLFNGDGWVFYFDQEAETRSFVRYSDGEFIFYPKGQ